MPSSSRVAPAGRRTAGAGRRRRRRLLHVSLATLATGAFAFGVSVGHDGQPASRAPGAAVVTFKAVGRTVLRVDLSDQRSAAEGRVALIAAARRSLRSRLAVRRGRARIVYRLNVAAALQTAVALAGSGGRVEVPATPVSARVQAPVIGQRLRNNCESAALAILLATRGVTAEQLELQRQLPRSGPLDPQQRSDTTVWGDPRLGYVGRVDGGGSAGGFGVYQGPVRAVAARHGVKLKDITGASVESVRTRLLAGEAVMVWIGLDAGPYGRWRSPEGRPVEVNFNEHTVVLTGARRDGSFDVVNPLEGTAELWSAARLAAAWTLLDRRALST